MDNYTKCLTITYLGIFKVVQVKELLVLAYFMRVELRYNFINIGLAPLCHAFKIKASPNFTIRTVL